MENSNSIVGQIIALQLQGYTAKQITAELKARPNLSDIRLGYVQTVLRQNTGRSADSRRLFEMYEILLEILGILKAMRSLEAKNIAARARRAERKLAALNGSSSPDRPA